MHVASASLIAQCSCKNLIYVKSRFTKANFKLNKIWVCTMVKSFFINYRQDEIEI